jgi:hypothetical protein
MWIVLETGRKADIKIITSNGSCMRFERKISVVGTRAEKCLLTVTDVALVNYQIACVARAIW